MAKRFEKTLELATDSTLLEPNWDGILSCVDAIRGGEVSPRVALMAIVKRCHSDNPHTGHHALLTLEACVKNCGTNFHKEVATKAFMEDMRTLATEGNSSKIREKVLELLQCWASAFKSKSEYKIVVDTHNLMKLSGVSFPAMREADAMFLSESAPEWADGEVCFRCRTQFGLITRKHHCRACGQVFCDRCSSKQMILPNFGIEKMVRVCDTCFNKRSSPSTERKNDGESAKSIDKTMDDKEANEKRLRELEAKEDEDIAKAIELSKLEAEKKNRELQQQREMLNYYNGTESMAEISTPYADTAIMSSASTTALNGHGVPPIYKNDSYVPYDRAPAKSVSEVNCVKGSVEFEAGPELSHYLDRDYWTERNNKNADLKASAPPPSELSYSGSASTMATPVPNSWSTERKAVDIDSASKNGGGYVGNFPADREEIDGDVEETAKFCQALEQQVTTMDNRIRSNLNRGRSIINDTAIQSLFVKLAELHSDVIRRMNDLDEKREYYEQLQDRVAHISEARLAVNALREDHVQEKRARELAEQQERQRQMQAKLDFMRNKKQEMLVYQRHLALQKFQQQEQEMQMRRMNPAPWSIPGVPVSAQSYAGGSYWTPENHSLAMTQSQMPNAIDQGQVRGQPPAPVFYQQAMPIPQSPAGPAIHQFPVGISQPAVTGFYQQPISSMLPQPGLPFAQQVQAGGQPPAQMFYPQPISIPQQQQPPIPEADQIQQTVQQTAQQTVQQTAQQTVQQNEVPAHPYGGTQQVDQQAQGGHPAGTNAQTEELLISLD
ncbi:hypothetical protein QR680_002483 [Steinernema hermaphroditum]|uniref:Hepatocyte growth factor-regulated tyrosine kinase substrate n=1 Tax=Steinernema hermaphroditum TaxID=289476 RepID=A0AA39LIC8_9BILA|nr:hypothetical protein QR680_002483 [Steinernema hermaphroditum]